MSDTDEKHPENIQLPPRSCENCMHCYVCASLASLIPWINRNMGFFNKTKLPAGVNPTIVTAIQKTVGDHCLCYKRDPDVLS